MFPPLSLKLTDSLKLVILWVTGICSSLLPWCQVSGSSWSDNFTWDGGVWTQVFMLVPQTVDCNSSPWPHFYLLYMQIRSLCYFHTYLFLTDFSIPPSSPLSHYLLKSLMSQIPLALSYHMCLLPPHTSILRFIWPFSGNSL